ncbi:pseudouridine synthase [Desulfobulbus alkaliphilus]|uniref:pseudouridine synthase n=1 Tax=Desulfobulbus alkaliphilus TaxID=869814 RepID=UPI001965D4F5|nr:RluA family pseudouridine synthase [Desulfobulbus alkaliphilus]
MKKIEVREATTLLTVLLKAGYSRTKIKQLLKYRAVRQAEQPLTRIDQELAPGTSITIISEKEASGRYRPCPGLPIVYEDEDILVINKPAGLLTIASATEREKTVYYRLTACLKDRAGKERIFLVHRLDQGASGLLVFAKTDTAQRALLAAWPDVRTRYRVIVEGVPQQSSGTVQSCLCESKIHRVYSVATDKGIGKYAETAYRVVRVQGEYALLEVIPVTSRKNQIRVHLADLGHPVVGDKKYGARTDPLRRMALQSSFLAFTHPVSGKAMEFSLEQPAAFKILMPGKKAVKP